MSSDTMKTASSDPPPRSMYTPAPITESLITPVDTAIQTATTAIPTIEVIAPQTLPEGYTFEAQMGEDKTFTVTVPKGGVEEGQRFSVPFPGGAGAVDGSMIRPRISVPVGHWKDGFCDCCKHGCCHPILCNAMFCAPIAVAQVMTRVKLNWLASPGTDAEARNTFPYTLFLLIIFIITDRTLLYIGVTSLINNPYPEPLSWTYLMASTFRGFFEICFTVYVVYIITMTRKFIRSKYAIPEKFGCEDCCCAFWCTCCTITQMARHTTDYDTYRGVCCSATGIPAHVPAIV